MTRPGWSTAYESVCASSIRSKILDNWVTYSILAIRNARVAPFGKFHARRCIKTFILVRVKFFVYFNIKVYFYFILHINFLKYSYQIIYFTRHFNKIFILHYFLLFFLMIILFELKLIFKQPSKLVALVVESLVPEVDD